MFYNGKLFTIYKIKFIAIIRHLAFLLDSDSLTVTIPNALPGRSAASVAVQREAAREPMIDGCVVD